MLVRLQKQSRQHTRWIIIGLAALVLSIGGLVSVGFTVHRVDHQEQQVEAIQARLAKRSSVLCPLYTVFIQSDTPQAAKIAKAQGQEAVRAHAFAVIRQGYIQLGCSPHLDKSGHLPPTAQLSTK